MAVKVRDLVRALRDVGASPIRTTGSHQTWMTAAGIRVVVVVNHMNAEACTNSLRQARQAGIKL